MRTYWVRQRACISIFLYQPMCVHAYCRNLLSKRKAGTYTHFRIHALTNTIDQSNLRIVLPSCVMEPPYSREDATILSPGCAKTDRC